jgi:thioredoxin 1
MQQLTTKELKEKIENKENFVLDFFATWCGPCKIMLNNLEQVNESLIKESNGSPSFGIYKFDIESDMELTRELGIKSVPTIKVFKKGAESFSGAGVIPPSKVLELIS